MTSFKNYLNFRLAFSVPAGNIDLLKAQYRALAYQLPMLYFILLISGWVMAYGHLGTVPNWMAIGAPLVLTIVCLGRGLKWWSRLEEEPSHDEAYLALRQTNVLAPALTLALGGWAAMLFFYGKSETQSQVVFFMGITAIGCIFCLMHLKSAAFMVAIIDNVMLIAFAVVQNQTMFIDCIINVCLVTAALLVILLYHHRDFERMVALNAENRNLANCDSLTGLPNRRSFFDNLDEQVEIGKFQSSSVSVGIIDLDGFKPVNDLYGHLMGDRLLCAVTHRLSLLCEGRAYISRLGGDEFALFITSDVDKAELEAFGNRLCDALRAPFTLGETVIQIGGSMGFATFPDHAQSAEQLYELADYALYHGKRHSRGRVNLFNAEHSTQMQEDAMLEIALRKADLATELFIVFQPIVDLSSNKTIGFEALGRWASPVHGQVSPSRFIPIAERSGLIGRITLILLGKALHAARQWPDEIRLSFNLSAYDLCSADIMLQIIQLIEHGKVPPKRIDLEITETALLHDIEQVQASIQMLKALGCGVSLDDFGTGYSSLSHLHALPFSKIKIDRSFVQAMDCKPASYKIVKSLLALSRDMGIDCVVEGVETESEMASLRVLGGKMVQGYYFSPPVQQDEVGSFIHPSSKPAGKEDVSHAIPTIRAMTASQ